MLTICVVDSELRRRLVLEEQLMRTGGQRGKCPTVNFRARELTLDIANITLISQEGENTLLELMNEGAVVSCRGVLMKHVLRQLMRQNNWNSGGTIC